MHEIIVKSPDQISKIRKSARLSADILYKLGEMVKPGVTLEDIDEECLMMTLDSGASPACLGYRGFPRSVCTSVNEVVCHGIPDEYVLKNGDIINIDVACNLDGFIGDTSFTFLCGDQVDESHVLLVNRCRTALLKAIHQVRPDIHIGDIGYTIETYANKYGYGVVKEFTGHGTGIQFHEFPSIPHTGSKNRGLQLPVGAIFTIEPMLNLGSPEIEIDSMDTWTVRTKDRKVSAQFEHTILVTESGFEILSYNEDLWSPYHPYYEVDSVLKTDEGILKLLEDWDNI
jgi:methionyl aminopeptidase